MLPTLHVYGQYTNHESVFLVGDLEALQRPRQVIDLAIEKKLAAGVFEVVDGEGYDIFVVQSDPTEIQKLVFPYQDEMYHEREMTVGKKPVVGGVISREDFRRLYNSEKEVSL